ncbi:hypothetical protein VTH06DRAFT_8182 [Thermothelomyces fergusii]
MVDSDYAIRVPRWRWQSTTADLRAFNQERENSAEASLNPSELNNMAMGAHMAEEKMPVAWTSRVWEGDPGGDVSLHFDGRAWMVKQDIVTAHFSEIKAAIARTKSGCPVLIRPRARISRHSKGFLAILQFLHTNELPSRLWEDSPSFFSYVKMYFLAERFRIDRLKRAMAAGVESLSQHVAALAAHHCQHCRLSRAEVDSEEKRHLESFVDAVRLMEAKPWSARIVKAMYDAGDRMKANLARLPAFCEFVEKSPEGKNFARAIGAHHV